MKQIEALEEAIKYFDKALYLAQAIGCNHTMIPYWRKKALTIKSDEDLVSGRLAKRIENQTKGKIKARWLAPETH